MHRSTNSFPTSARTISSTLPYTLAADAIAPSPPVLRLVHGSSDDTLCFTHRTRTPGAVSTVGASLGCDWTVRAAGVPGVAFALREDRGTLSICPARDAAVFVNGRRELPLWRSLRVGSRVDVGLLRIEVVSGAPEVVSGAPERDHRERVPAPREQPPRLREDTVGPLPSLLGVAEDASLDTLPLRFPWALCGALSACAALYLLAVSLLE
jgi:hypothetical protein